MPRFDGHDYTRKEDIPDTGSFGERIDGMYWGLFLDMPKLQALANLPQYSDLSGDTMAYCKDTKQLFIYNPSDKTWYLQ